MYTYTTWIGHSTWHHIGNSVVREELSLVPLASQSHDFYCNFLFLCSHQNIIGVVIVPQDSLIYKITEAKRMDWLFYCGAGGTSTYSCVMCIAKSTFILPPSNYSPYHAKRNYTMLSTIFSIL